MNGLLLFICLFASFTIGNGYKPVLCIPGFPDFTPGFDLMCQRIQELHPGTVCGKIQNATFLGSALPLWAQVEIYRPILQKYFEMYPGGVHIVAHSMGTMLSRAIISTCPNHPVHNYIALSGPHNGVYAVPLTNISALGLLNPSNLAEPLLTNFFYSALGQNSLSGAGLWRCPTRETDFRKDVNFLPCINGLRSCPQTPNIVENFMKIKKYFVYSAENDEQIIPNESSRFEWKDSNGNNIPMKNTVEYKNNTWALKAIDDRGDLSLTTIPGAHHLDMIMNQQFVNDYYINNLD